MTRAIWISVLRLTRSASLPQIGVLMVVVSSVAVTTQVKAVCVPLRSARITGSDDDTTEVARIDTNMPRRIPERASSTWRWVICWGSPGTCSSPVVTGAEPAVSVVLLIRVPLRQTSL